MPTSRSSDSVFGSAKSLLDIPRSVTVLTPELMQKLGVRNFDDVARVIPGGERPNYYGVPGTPFIRGDAAGTFFNGMQRIYQRNEMPTASGRLTAWTLSADRPRATTVPPKAAVTSTSSRSRPTTTNSAALSAPPSARMTTSIHSSTLADSVRVRQAHGLPHLAHQPKRRFLL